MTTESTTCPACSGAGESDAPCPVCGTIATSKSLPLLTVSRMRSFRGCMRRHHHEYVEGVRPLKTAEALRFGSLFHLGLEAWWRWHMSPPPPAPAPAHDDPLSAMLDAVAGRGVDPFDQARADELLRGYDARWRAAMDDLDVLAVEVVFDAPLLNPATLRASRTWRLAGKIDAIARRRDDGAVLVVEHKTTSEGMDDDAAHYWATLAIDHQCSAYVIGAETLGHQVTEILYDVARKPGLRPLLATPIEKQKRKPDGTLYANQREFDESPDEYRERIRTALAEDPDRHYQRRAIPRTDNQLVEFAADAWIQASAMRDAAEFAHVPRNPEACHRFGTCPYFAACSTGQHPREFVGEFAEVADVHPELGRETS